jgi:hypothetical protein
MFKALGLYWIPAKFARIVICALYCNFTQRTLVVGFRRFGTTYRSHLQGSSIAFNKEVEICGAEKTLVEENRHRIVQYCEEYSLLGCDGVVLLET